MHFICDVDVEDGVKWSHWIRLTFCIDNVRFQSVQWFQNLNENALIRSYFAGIKRHTGPALAETTRRINAPDSISSLEPNSKLEGHFLAECRTNEKCVTGMAVSTVWQSQSLSIHFGIT